MTFVKGQSGCPTGRPRGARNKRSLIAEEFAKQGSAVAQRVLEAALEGDMAAASLVLSRLEPPLRPRAAPVTVSGFDPTNSVADNAKAILVSVMTGEIDADTARFMLDALSAYCGLTDVSLWLADLKRMRESRRNLPTVVNP